MSHFLIALYKHYTASNTGMMSGRHAVNLPLLNTSVSIVHGMGKSVIYSTCSHRAATKVCIIMLRVKSLTDNLLVSSTGRAYIALTSLLCLLPSQQADEGPWWAGLELILILHR